MLTDLDGGYSLLNNFQKEGLILYALLGCLDAGSIFFKCEKRIFRWWVLKKQEKF
jgi:hypothetical protein